MEHQTNGFKNQEDPQQKMILKNINMNSVNVGNPSGNNFSSSISKFIKNKN